MRNLTETIVTIALSLALIAATYHYYGVYLAGLVTKAFAGIADPL